MAIEAGEEDRISTRIGENGYVGMYVCMSGCLV